MSLFILYIKPYNYKKINKRITDELVFALGLIRQAHFRNLNMILIEACFIKESDLILIVRFNLKTSLNLLNLPRDFLLAVM